MSSQKPRVTQQDYCQFLLSSQVNYTLTYYADHVQHLTHDAINRYLAKKQLRPHQVWESVRDKIVTHPTGFVVFDDTVMDKQYATAIESVRAQYSGNAKRVIKGIGVVTCVYVNPTTQQFWIIDFRIFDPDCDEKTKLDHVQEMFHNLTHHKNLPFSTVLMDTWYAAKSIMRTIEQAEKIYICPIRKNRKVDETNGEEPYKRVDELTWSSQELETGKTIHLFQFPKGHQVKLFRLDAPTGDTEFIVTNDLTQQSAQDVLAKTALRWKIEEFHREAKQVTGLESCQCRRRRIQRNHITCAMLVWTRLKEVAYATQQTIYQIKRGLLDAYLIRELKHPTIAFA